MMRRWRDEDDARLEAMEREMAGPLADTRAAARVYAERAWQRDVAGQHDVAVQRVAAGSNEGAPLRSGVRQAGRRSVWKGWAVGSAAAGIVAAALLTGGVHRWHASQQETAETGQSARVETVRPGEAASVSDDALLRQIDRDLSSGVPVAMQPLEASNARRGSTRQAE